MLLVWTEGTDVAWGVVYEAMAHHFILALEAFPAECARTALYWAEVWAILGVHVCMRATISLGPWGFHLCHLFGLT